MALITTTGVEVSLDETSGLQNASATATPAGDANDNDTSLTLPTPFSGRLSTLLAATTPTETLINAALSGYNGSNTGQNAFTITPSAGGTITDIRFTDSTGALLAGVDSGLDTAGGVSIYLYTDTTNNNIVLGRAAASGGGADPNGAIVFAAYMEETGSPVSGGKIWTVLYQPLYHSDTSTADDSVNLLNKVFIGTTQDTEFSLANAPSGQNLFLMFTTANPTVATVDGVARITGVTIIATGKNPADQSSGANITTGDTINTSQAGGPTTFGTNNQMITEQEGIRYTFVTGARQNVTIPNLDQNEADLEANIDFTAVFSARTATFDVVQLQSGKSAQVKISAFNTAAEPGVNFIDGYANDSTVAITNVRVINTATGQVIENSNGSVNDPSIAISFTAGVATITGVLAGHKIEYTTTADHNRVLVENGAALDAKGNDHADFDIGGFKLLQVSTETAEIGSKIFFEDDGPSISTTGTEPVLTVDETVLANDATQNFAANFTSAFGADGAGTLTYALGVVAGPSGLTDTATGEAVNLSLTAGGVVEGRTATTNLLVFKVSVAANGDVTLDQQRAVVHSNTTNPDDSISLTADNLVTLTATKTDKDGDSAQATLNIGQNLSFEDDGPSISVSLAAAADALAVDETDLATNASASFADNFGNLPSYGADGAGTVGSAYALSVKSAGVDSGLVDVASGEAVLLTVNAGVVEGRITTGNALVFTVSVSAAGLVSLDQIRALKHPDGSNPDDAVSPSAADLITLTRTDTITDKDGDTSTGSASLDIANALSFEDDGPSISTTGTEPVLTVDETLLANDATQNFAANFSSAFGADGAGTLTYALGVVAGPSGLTDTATGEAVNLSLNGTVVEGRTATTNLLVFTVSVATNGDVTLDQQRAVVHPVTTNPDDSISLTADNLVTLTATKTDKDGDSAQATLNIGQNLNFEDDGPAVSANLAVKLDDDALTGGNAGGTGDDANAENTSGTLAHSFGADGAGSIAYLTTGAPAGFSYEAGASGSLLVKQGTTTVLTLTLNTATGAYAVTQNAPIAHAAGLDENNQAFTVSYQVTDRDGDTASGTLSIDVDDDTPTVTTSPVKDTTPTLGTTLWTYSEAFAYSIGADHHGPTYSATNSDFAALSLSGFANDAAIGSPSVSWFSESDSQATFNLSLNYDHDRNGTATEPVTGQLVFDKTNDTYTVTLDALQVKQDVTLSGGTGYETYDIGGTTPSSGPSPVATGKLGEGFYLQITGFESPLSADGNSVVSAGELVSGTVAPVTLSSTALGVSGNTIQSGEAANLGFFATDPKGNQAATDFAYATDFYIKFDGIETESDDLILMLNLVNASNPALTTTRAVYVDQGDIYESDTGNAGLVGTKYQPIVATLDNNDGLLIVESNDFNVNVGDNWVLKGMQILSNDAGLTGDAINLNRAVGSSGGSSYAAVPVSGLIGPGNTIAEDNSTNPLKIIDAGFSTTTTTPPTLDLALAFKVVDADGDFTAVQTIDIEYPAQVAVSGISPLEMAGLA